MRLSFIAYHRRVFVIAVVNTRYKERSSAVAVTADRTAYDVRYSYRTWAGMAVVIKMSIYLFIVSCRKSAVNACQLFSRSLCFITIFISPVMVASKVIEQIK